jgi:type IV pilus assembly protein PilC
MVRPIERVMLAKQLATMIRSGITLDEALDILVSQAVPGRLRLVLRDVRTRVVAGERLSEALTARPGVFSSLFISMVRVGEASGTLEVNLRYIGAQLENEYELRRKVRAASAYPALVFLLTIVMGMGLSYFILPKLIPLFTSFRVTLPLSTVVVLAIARWVARWGMIAFPVVVIGFFLLRLLLRSPLVRPAWHRVIAALPLFGSLSVCMNLARMGKTAGVLLEAGLPIVDALQITGETMQNENYRRLLLSVRTSVEGGVSLEDAFRVAGTSPRIIPPLVSRMLTVGERSGTLTQSFLSLADFFEREVDTATKNLSTILEPVLILLIGTVVGVLALSIITPIYSVTGSLRI